MFRWRRAEAARKLLRSLHSPDVASRMHRFSWERPVQPGPSVTSPRPASCPRWAGASANFQPQTAPVPVDFPTFLRSSTSAPKKSLSSVSLLDNNGETFGQVKGLTA